MPHFATDFDQVGPSVRHHIFLLVCGIALDENSWSYHIDFELGLDLKGEVMGSYVNGAGSTAISAFLHRANDKTTGQGGQQCKLGSSNCTLVTDKRKPFIHMGYASRLDTMTTGVTYINCLFVPLQLNGDGIRSGRRPRRCRFCFTLSATLWPIRWRHQNSTLQRSSLYQAVFLVKPVIRQILETVQDRMQASR